MDPRSHGLSVPEVSTLTDTVVEVQIDVVRLRHAPEASAQAIALAGCDRDPVRGDGEVGTRVSSARRSPKHDLPRTRTLVWGVCRDHGVRGPGPVAQVGRDRSARRGRKQEVLAETVAHVGRVLERVEPRQHGLLRRRVTLEVLRVLVVDSARLVDVEGFEPDRPEPLPEVIDLLRGLLRIAAPVVHFENVLVLDPAVGVAPGVVVSHDLDPQRQHPGVDGLSEPWIHDRVGDPLLREVAHAHPPVHPAVGRREAVALLATVVAVSPEGPPVQEPRGGELEQIELGEAAVALQGDGQAPERPPPERVLSHRAPHLPGCEGQERHARARVGRAHPPPSRKRGPPCGGPEDGRHQAQQPVRHQPICVHIVGFSHRTPSLVPISDPVGAAPSSSAPEPSAPARYEPAIR